MMMEAYIMTIDVGTTSVKTAVFDKELHCVASASEDYALDAGRNGFLEFEAEKYLEVIRRAAGRMFQGKEKLGEKICAIVPTTQGETLIPVDKNGKALRKAIVWMDGRAQEQAKELGKEFPPERLYPLTGVSELAGTVPICKAMWICQNEPEVFADTEKFLLLEDWVLFMLTGKFVTNKVLLSSSGYYDIINDRYYEEIILAAGLRRSHFPEAYEPGTCLGKILPEAAKKLGISGKAEIFTGAMDQPLAALAAGNCREGVITETTGTCMVIGASSKKPDFGNPYRMIIYRHILPGMYFVMPDCMTAGMVLKWFLQEFEEELRNGESPYDRMTKRAEKIPPGADGLILLPYFTGIQTPEINPDACGVFFGLDLSMGRDHMIRAIIESVGYMLKENLKAVQQVARCHASRVRAMGGGAKSDVWLQIKSDICQIEMDRMAYTECTSLGAAMVGAVAMGWFPGYEAAVEKSNCVGRVFTPRRENRDVYEKRFKKFLEIYGALKPVFYSRSEV